MDILRFLHSGVRWLVLLVALIDLVYFALGWLQGRGYDQLARRLISIFGMVISLQWLIGVVFLIVLGGQTGFGVRHYWEHLTVMTIAVFVANLPNMLRRRRIERISSAIWSIWAAIIAVIVLVVIGISLLPEAIRWRFFLPA